MYSGHPPKRFEKEMYGMENDGLMNGSEQMGLFILFPYIHGSKTIP